MRILSLDASTNKTGWCVFEDAHYVKSGIIDLHKDKDSEHRLCSMMYNIASLIKAETPDRVVLEETTLSSNAKILRVLAQLGGFIKGFCFIKKINIEMIYPTAWRSLVGIKEGAKVKRQELKEQAILLCKDKLGLDLPEDEAEATMINLAIHMRDNEKKETEL